MSRILIVVVCVACLPLKSVEGADTIMIGGETRVIDKDTLEVKGERVRLRSINTPERDQSWRIPLASCILSRQIADDRPKPGFAITPLREDQDMQDLRAPEEKAFIEDLDAMGEELGEQLRQEHFSRGKSPGIYRHWRAERGGKVHVHGRLGG